MEEDPVKTALIMYLSIVYPTLQMLGDLLSESSPRVGAQSGLSQSTLMAYTFSFVNCLWKTLVNSTNTHVSLSYTVHHREIWGVCKGCVREGYAVSCPARARLSARNGLVNEVKFLGLITQNG